MKAPFFHEEIEVKKNFLAIAREFAQAPELEKELAAAMLYANMSEYLAYNLLESLKQTVFTGSKAFWNGVVYVDQRESSEKLTIGQIARELERYGFPSKELIIPLLDRIAKNRNKVMHNMLRTPAKDMGIIDAAIAELERDSEELITCIDDIYRGLPPKNVTETVSGSPPPELETVADDAGEITVKDKKLEKQSSDKKSAKS